MLLELGFLDGWALGGGWAVGATAVAVLGFPTSTSPLAALGVLPFGFVMVRSAVLAMWRGGVVWRDTFSPDEDGRRGPPHVRKSLIGSCLEAMRLGRCLATRCSSRSRRRAPVKRDVVDGVCADISVLMGKNRNGELITRIVSRFSMSGT